MLNQTLITLYQDIAEEAKNMVQEYVDHRDLTGMVNYASIFAQSEDEFHRFSEEIKANGTVFDVQPTGNYYLLNEPFITSAGEITVCRVRKYDVEHPEKGYLDFEVNNYQQFKEKYLTRPYFSLLSLPHVELVELRVPGYTIRAYFPDGF